MRGSGIGALDRTYLHSAITEALWYAVAESERIFSAKMFHCVMLASLYGNPDANLSDGNDQIHEMYMAALDTMPYIGTFVRRKPSDTDNLVEEWRKANEEVAAKESGT